MTTIEEAAVSPEIVADGQVFAPDIFPAELAHLLTRAERQKRIAIGQADALWQSVMLAPPKRPCPYGR